MKCLVLILAYTASIAWCSDANLEAENSASSVNNETCKICLSAVSQCASVWSQNEIEDVFENTARTIEAEEYNFSEFLVSFKQNESTVSNSNNSETTSDSEEEPEKLFSIQNAAILNRNLISNNKFSDCIFLIGPNRTEVKANSVILRSSSPVFEALFAEDVHRKILIPDSSVEAFEALLDFVYTREFCVDDFSVACELIDLSNRFSLPKLQEYNRNFLKTQLKPSNVWKAITCSSKVNDTEMMRMAMKVLQSETEEALSHPSFINISQPILYEFLSLDVLNVDSELKVIDATLRWAVAEASRKSLTPEPETLRLVLGSALGRLRFLTLTASEFANLQYTARILNYSESLAIIFNLNSPGIAPLPENLSSEKKKRFKPFNNSKNVYTVSEKITMPCSQKQRKILIDKEDDELKMPIFYTDHSQFPLAGLTIPSQVCSIPMNIEYEEDLTIVILLRNSKTPVYTYHFSEQVNCDSLMEIRFPSEFYLVNGLTYTLQVNFRKEGNYLRVYKSSQTKQWPIHKASIEFADNMYYYQLSDSFVESLISTNYYGLHKR